MLSNYGNVAETYSSDFASTVPISQILTMNEVMVVSENNKICITFEDDTQQNILIKVDPDIAYQLGQMLLQSVAAYPMMMAESFSANGRNQNSHSQNGHTHPETAESPELDIDDETETLAQLYEQVKDHPLAGLIGTYDETDDSTDITDASMNVHKYLAEYHAEQHAE